MAAMKATDTIPDACCPSDREATCCEPSAKADCCGHGEACGCDAAVSTPERVRAGASAGGERRPRAT
jgi:hypothetical protein